MRPNSGMDLGPWSTRESAQFPASVLLATSVSETFS